MITSQINLNTNITDLNGFLDHILNKTNMKCLTPRQVREKRGWVRGGREREKKKREKKKRERKGEGKPVLPLSRHCLVSAHFWLLICMHGVYSVKMHWLMLALRSHLDPHLKHQYRDT